MLTSTHERLLTAQLDRLEGIVAELLERNERLNKLLAVAKAPPAGDAELIKTFMDRQEDLMDRFQEMVGTIHHHQVRQYEAPTFTSSDIPKNTADLYSNEDEDDLRYMEAHGALDPSELAQRLQELNFLNSDIDIR